MAISVYFDEREYFCFLIISAMQVSNSTQPHLLPNKDAGCTSHPLPFIRPEQCRFWTLRIATAIKPKTTEST